jgi:hypothetical protein
MSRPQLPAWALSRRTLLATAFGGTVAAIGGGMLTVDASAGTTSRLKVASAQPKTGQVPAAVAAASLVTTGIDYAWARPRPSVIKSSGYNFACRYLSYNTTGKNLTASEAQALIAAGVSIVSNWEYSTSDALGGFNKGVTIATEAQRQALACGAPADRPIYFSVDFDATEAQQATINAYYDGIASVIGRGRTGAYGGYYVIKRLFDAGKITWGWQTYAWSGGNWDSRAQLRQVKNGITVDGGDCDKDEAWAADYGQWGGTPAGGALSVSSNADGRLQVVVERAGSLITAAQATAGGAFGAFTSLGGAQLSATVESAVNADGRLEAFVLGGDSVPYTKSQTTAGGGFDADWLTLTTTKLKCLAVGANADKRLQAFGVGTDGVLHTSVQDSPSGTFGSWTSLAGAQLGGVVATGSNPDGRLNVFVLGGDGLVYSKVQTAANGGFGDWVDHNGSALRCLAVGANADGRLELFGTGTDGIMYTSFQTSVNGNFGDWYSMAGAQLGSQVCTAQNADGRLQVFVLGGDGHVYSKVQASPNGAMGDWQDLGAALLRSLDVGKNADGRLQLVAIGGDGVVYTSVQSAPNGTFGGWTNVG